jgi:pimeloyl-ACP methyl ester carboxylesterase
VVQRSTELTSPRTGQFIADSILRAKLDTFPNSSHCPFWEEAGRFKRAVTQFADELG